MTTRIVLLFCLALFIAPVWAQAPPPAPMLSEKTPSIASPAAGQPGVAVDAQGRGVVDPTKNVLDLVSAMKEMLKELRTSDKELFDAKLTGERSLAELRATYEGKLLKAATDRLDSQAKQQADFNERYALTEKGRVDAIRLVDKNAADVATAQALATATGLAKTVQDTAATLSTQSARQAEDLRKLVETTALETNRNVQQQFANVQTQFTGIGTRLTALEQAGAEGLGRAKFQDPNTQRLLDKVESLVTTRSTTAGVAEGQSNVIGFIVGGLGLIGMFAGVGISLAVALRSKGR